MKKNRYAGAICGILMMLMAGSAAFPALAQNYGLGEAGGKAGYQQTDIYAVIGQVINMGLGLVAILFFGVMMYAGFRWMTARGNEEYANKAKNALEAGAIGLLVILAAYGISTYIFQAISKGQ